MSRDRTRWQQLLNPEPPTLVWVRYEITVPSAGRPGTLVGYTISGWEGEAEKEMERLVRAFRAIGDEPVVTKDTKEPVHL